DGPEDEALMDDRPVRLERPLRCRLGRGAPTLLLKEHDQFVRLEVEVLRVVAKEAARVHSSGESGVIPRLERRQELLADAGVGRGLLERDAFALALRAQLLAEARHRPSPSRRPRASCRDLATVR